MINIKQTLKQGARKQKINKEIIMPEIWFKNTKPSSRKPNGCKYQKNTLLKINLIN